MKKDKGFLRAIMYVVIIGLIVCGGGMEGQAFEKEQNVREQEPQDSEEALEEKEPEDIYVCKYCDSYGTWKYLILVREGSDGAWKVIYHGSFIKNPFL